MEYHAYQLMRNHLIAQSTQAGSRTRPMQPTTIQVDNYQFVWIIDGFVDKLSNELDKAEGIQFSALTPKSPATHYGGRHNIQKSLECRATLCLKKNNTDKECLSFTLTVEPVNCRKLCKYKLYITTLGEVVDDDDDDDDSTEMIMMPMHGEGLIIPWKKHLVHESDEYEWCDERHVVEIPNFVDVNVILNDATNVLPNGSLAVCCELSILDADALRIADKKKSPTSDLQSDLASLLQQENSFDVKLVVGKKVFGAHKIFLGSRSSVFNAMFTHEMTEKKDGIIEINDVNPKVFEQLLQFIYTARVPNLRDVAADLLVAADKYDLQKLKGVCEDEIIKQLKTDNVAEMLILADQMGADKLKKDAMQFIKENSDIVTETPGWNLLLEHPLLITNMFKCAYDKKETSHKHPRSSSLSSVPVVHIF